MYSLDNLHLECNSKIKLNFNGGDLSSDSGLFLLKEFDDIIDFHQIIKKLFKTKNKASSWDYPRRVIVKVEKPSNQFTYQYGSKSRKYP